MRRRFYCATACLFALYAVSCITSSRVPSSTRFDATRDASARVVVDGGRDENDDDETGVAEEKKAVGLVVPEEDDVVVDDAAVGGLAWLASFPNSGTSYTLRVARRVSRARAATNYGAENERLGVASVPVYPSRSREGPYLLSDASSSDRVTPSRANGSYVLTKTHCGARCLRCPPSRWLETTASFSVACRTAQGWVASTSSTTRVPLLERVETVYADDLVERAVHLFRDPFDNVVSRFHLEHNARVKKGDDAWTARFPRAPEGFRAWCRDMDATDRKRERGFVFPERLRPFFAPSSDDDDDRSSRLLCRAEFARYAHWHDLAFRVVEALGVPEHVLHYVDYRDDLEVTVDSLLDFLGLERRETTSTEFRWSDYSDYYDAEQREALWELVRATATDRTWKELERYRR